MDFEFLQYDESISKINYAVSALIAFFMYKKPTFH